MPDACGSSPSYPTFEIFRAVAPLEPLGILGWASLRERHTHKTQHNLEDEGITASLPASYSP